MGLCSSICRRKHYVGIPGLGSSPDVTVAGLGRKVFLVLWLWSDNQHGRVEIARLSRNATDIDLDFGSCLDCAFQKARRVVIRINLNSGNSQRQDAAFTNGAWPS